MTFGEGSGVFAISRDGRRVACSQGHFQDRADISLWEIATGKCLRRLTAEAPVSDLAFDSDDSHLITSGSNVVQLWRLR